MFCYFMDTFFLFCDDLAKKSTISYKTKTVEY